MIIVLIPIINEAAQNQAWSDLGLEQIVREQSHSVSVGSPLPLLSDGTGQIIRNGAN
ncbi:hypothetical protein [uncultured Nostoc sp.]|uniref:hypothetical protein n=1 Tax=uncultured Nostoc sp. TaxID=340711 RepID=UPI0035C9F5AA